MPDAPRLLSRLVRGSAVAGIIRLGGLALAFIFLLLLAQRMTDADFGTFSVLFSLAGLLSYVANIGQHVAILRFWPSLDETYGEAVATRAMVGAARLALLGGVVLALLVVAFGAVTASIRPIAATTGDFAWAGSLLLVTTVAEFSASAFRAQGRITAAYFPRDIAWRATVIAALLLTPAPLGVSGALAIVSAALMIMVAPQVFSIGRQALRNRGASVPSSVQRHMRGATWRFWASTSITPLMDHGTVIIVGFTLGPIAAGAFFAADRLAKLLLIALIGIEQVGGPMLARSFHSGRIEDVRSICSAISAAAFAVALIGAVAYLFLGPLALSLFSPSYQAAWPVLLVLILGQLVNTACGANVTLLDMAGREGDVLAIRLIWGLVSVIAVPLAALEFGIVGAAAASTIVVAGWNITALIVCRVRFGFWTTFRWPFNM